MIGKTERLAGLASQGMCLCCGDGGTFDCRYSGTSADLVKTCFDLIVSVKLFLGRFDMRTLQVGS